MKSALSTNEKDYIARPRDPSGAFDKSGYPECNLVGRVKFSWFCGSNTLLTINCRPTTRHSAISRYHWFSGRVSAEFVVGLSLNPLSESVVS